MGVISGLNGGETNTCRILVGKSDGGRPLGTRGRGWRMLLKWILKKEKGKIYTPLLLFVICTDGGIV